MDSATQHNHPGIEDVAPGKRIWVAKPKAAVHKLAWWGGYALSSSLSLAPDPHISSTQQETFTPCLGAFFTLVGWSCFLIYLYFNFAEVEHVLPT